MLCPVLAETSQHSRSKGSPYYLTTRFASTFLSCSRSCLLPTKTTAISPKLTVWSVLDNCTGEAHPLLDFEVAHGVSDVVDNHNSSCSFVVYFSQWLEAFLPGSVPKSDFECLLMQTDGLAEEFYSHWRLFMLAELVPHVAGGDIGLTGTTFPNYDHLVHLKLVVHLPTCHISTIQFIPTLFLWLISYHPLSHRCTTSVFLYPKQPKGNPSNSSRLFPLAI